MSTVPGQAIFTDVQAAAPKRVGILRKVYNARADYLYVLPAIVVMLIVIAYPVYYTIELSFFKPGFINSIVQTAHHVLSMVAHLIDNVEVTTNMTSSLSQGQSICLFILAIISIPVVAMYGKADHTSETDEPKSLTVVVEDEPLKMQVMELKDSLGKLTDSVKETGTAASDERKSVVAAVNELRAKIDQRLTTVEKAVSMLSESLKQEKDIDPKQQ